jgi:hypothetical protein
LFPGAHPGEYKEFLYEPNVNFYHNGSLEFLHISKDSEGYYLCEAKNEVGTGVSKVIFLKVNGKLLLGFVATSCQHCISTLAVWSYLFIDTVSN